MVSSFTGFPKAFGITRPLKKMLISKINAQNSSSCFSGVGDVEKDHDCASTSIKHGKTTSGKQRYLCKKCSVSFVEGPEPNGYKDKYDLQIISLKKEGLLLAVVKIYFWQ